MTTAIPLLEECVEFVRMGEDPTGVIASVCADFNLPHQHFRTDAACECIRRAQSGRRIRTFRPVR
jgi:hypothetical protein